LTSFRSAWLLLLRRQALRNHAWEHGNPDAGTGTAMPRASILIPFIPNRYNSYKASLQKVILYLNLKYIIFINYFIPSLFFSLLSPDNVLLKIGFLLSS